MERTSRAGRIAPGRATGLGLVALGLIVAVSAALANPRSWRAEWPRTDFSSHSVAFSEIMSGGPRKDGIPPIDKPKFVPAATLDDLGPQEPVISVTIDGDVRAYPLRILMWHEIVNDTVGGVPITVTYCPLCNSAVVFDRRLGERVLDFGTTGKLRNSDLVMYDRQTESWWQQFVGEAIVGELTGARLDMLPSRVESWERFLARAPEGKVLVPNDRGLRAYGLNPYLRYDSSDVPGMYLGKLPAEVAPLSRVVVVGGEAWSFDLLRRHGTLTQGDLILTWEPGQNSALDASVISMGRDVGNVAVQRRTAVGLQDVVHDVSFAFAFRAFYPDGVIHVQ
jgi:hypothetical protein